MPPAAEADVAGSGRRGRDAAAARRRRRPLQRLTLAALAVAVTVVHLWLADTAMPDAAGDGGAALPPRIEVAFVAELAPAEPPPPPAPATRRLPAPPAPASAASAAQAPLVADAAAVEPLDAPLLAEPPSLPALSLRAEAPAAAPPPDAASAVAASPASAPRTVAAVDAAAAVAGASVAAASSPGGGPVGAEWPPSTRLSYTLSGHYRGPVEGQAQVEWLRSGSRYQVRMDLGIGPAFAPLMSRRVASEGLITAAGLHPQRYDEETRIVTRDPRHLVVRLDDDVVRLSNGAAVPRPPGVQDSASQFVQLTWLFTMQPALLEPGTTIELPLALPRRVQTWSYDVLAAETLATPAGPVRTLHVKPRRDAKPGAELVAEIWVAPSLQYLPVRLLIRQDAENFVDLLIDRLPQQAAPPPPR